MSHEATDEDKKRHAAMVALREEVLALLDELEEKANEYDERHPHEAPAQTAAVRHAVRHGRNQRGSDQAA